MTETSGRDNVISVAARAIAEGRDQPVMVHSSALAQCAISAIEQAGFAITRIDGESDRTVPTCCVTGRISGDSDACGDCDPCIKGAPGVQKEIKALMNEKDEWREKYATLAAIDGESAADSDFREFLRERLSIASEAHHAAIENHNWMDAHSMAVRTKAFGEALQMFDNQQAALAAAERNEETG